MNDRLRRRLASLGIPSCLHDRGALSALLPPGVPLLEGSDLPEVVIQLASKGLIHCPSLHTCRLYDSREQYLALACEFLIAGLKRGERALWVLPDHVGEDEARMALDGPWRPGAVLLLREPVWYADLTRVFGAWLEQEKRALAEGFAGLCATGDAAFAGCSEEALNYEEAVTDVFAGRRIRALCTYPAQMVTPALLRRLRACHHDVAAA